MAKAGRGIGITSPPPQPQKQQRFNAQDRRYYNQLQKGNEGRLNAQERRFMNQFEQARAPQPQQQWQPQRPQMAPPSQGPQGGPMAQPMDRMNPGQIQGIPGGMNNPLQWQPQPGPGGMQGQYNKPWVAGVGGYTPNIKWLNYGQSQAMPMAYQGGSATFNENNMRPLSGATPTQWRRPPPGSSSGGY